jgi:magnesium transporter
MDEHLEVLVSTVRDLVESQRADTAAATVEGLHPSDLSAVLAELEIEPRATLILALRPDDAAQAVWELDEDDRLQTLASLDDGAVRTLAATLPDDGVADLMRQLDPARVATLLPEVAPDRRATVERLLGHEEQTAGALMSTSFVAVAPGTRVGDVFDVLRAHRDAGFVYYVYILDGAGHPLGVTTLRDLVVADPSSVVDASMRTDLLTVTVHADQEEVARIASRYDLLAVPVVSEGRMLGVVTADDVLEVLESEAEEDIERFVGSVELEPRRSALVAGVRARTPWMLGTFAIELAVAWAFLRPLPLRSERTLLAFLPLLLFTGGNAAIASAGVALRRIVRGERSPFRLISRELQGAVLLGAVAAVLCGAALFLGAERPALTAVIAATVGLTVAVSSMVGAMAPLVLWGLGRDPALASGPLMGVLADAAALGVYLLAARVLL